MGREIAQPAPGRSLVGGAGPHAGGVAEDDLAVAGGGGGRAPAGGEAGGEQLVGGGALVPDGDRRYAAESGGVVDEVELVAVGQDDVVGVLVLADAIDQHPANPGRAGGYGPGPRGCAAE